MKILIWIGCFVVATILNTLLGYATGFKAGFLPFYLAVYFVAKKLCSKWDERKTNKAMQSHASDLQSQPVETDDQVRFCRKCGEKLIENSRFCRKCGTEIVEVKRESD